MLAAFILASCAHQGDDDYPVMKNKIGKHQEPAVIPVAPPPAPAPAAPLVTLPPPPAPKPLVGKPIPGANAPGAQSSSGPSPTVAVAGNLLLNEPLSAPVKRLISAAEDSLKKGRILEARAQADRAYRMDLRDPRTSFLMARVSEREKAFEDAEQWAMRSLENLNDTGNKRVVWGFIAKVREKNGNKKGMQEALKQIR